MRPGGRESRIKALVGYLVAPAMGVELSLRCTAFSIMKKNVLESTSSASNTIKPSICVSLSSFSLLVVISFHFSGLNSWGATGEQIEHKDYQG